MLQVQLCFLFLTLTPSKGFATIHDQAPTNVAIIGGGIGGTSASYFLRKSFGKSTNIDIFEKDLTLCGRLATVSIGGREYEAGGSIIHPKNKYMKTFVKTLSGLEEANRYDGGFFGIFDGTDYIFQESEWAIVTLIKMIWTFGINLIRINRIEKKFLSDFNRIYDLQEQGMSFENMTELFSALGGDAFMHVTEMTSKKYFMDNGISDFTISNLVSPALRNNYGQNASVNAFVGAVSMAGIESGLWSVKRGNKEVCYGLVENSSATLIHEEVSKVGREESGKFSIVTSQSHAKRMYDIVILAAPVGGNMYHIDVSEACQGTPPSFDGKRYRRTVANFIHGKLNSSIFHCDSVTSCPSDIFISNQQLFYSKLYRITGKALASHPKDWLKSQLCPNAKSIGYHMPVDYDPEEGAIEGVYKVFSTEPLTEEQKNYLFETHSETATVDWKAYPQYRPPDIPGSFVLNDGFYYTSPVEWAASAMEMSTISAKNSALLAYNNWFAENHSTKPSTNMKAEL